MKKLNASEAIYGFCGWLTTRKEETKMGSKNDCAIIAELANEFCKENKLEEPRNGWENILIHPSGQISSSKVENKTTEKEHKTVNGKIDTGKISDGYHTFDELYEHRITLFIALCKAYDDNTFVGDVWRSKLHSDGTMFDDWFIMGIGRGKGQQITYHLPISKWKETEFAETLENAPEWDGHTPEDVLKRINKL